MRTERSILAIDVDEAMTVNELQGILAERTDIPKEDQRIIFGGRPFICRF